MNCVDVHAYWHNAPHMETTLNSPQGSGTGEALIMKVWEHHGVHGIAATTKFGTESISQQAVQAKATSKKFAVQMYVFS